ncbi:adhesion G protein-coupled receptor L3-like [Dysidea avara]|uniref:adhesion G protein-coupled receptor L3-like n=1 Tax=Dysidea avara TaxID=196820 RepID=UPI00333462F0
MSYMYNILIACDNDFSEALFWPNSQQNSLVTQSCSQLHPSFRSGVNIGRQCRSDGSWSPVDLRNCTMFIGSESVVIIYFTVTMNNTDMMISTDIITDNVLMRLGNDFSLDVTNPMNRTWSYISTSGATFVSFALSFNLQNSVTSNLIENIQNVLKRNSLLPNRSNVTSEGFQIIIVHPGLSCSCDVNVTNNDKMITVCVGPSDAPCLCDSSCCACNTPTFVGDGHVCGLDSDSDGFPDVGLDCDEPSCIQDICPDVYSIGTQRSEVCMKPVDIDFIGCQFEQDDTWNITWPAIGVDETAIQKCPGGSEAQGLASRRCDGDDQWASPNVSQCQTIEQIRLRMRAEELRSLVNNIFIAENRDMTVMFIPEDVVDITTELDEITTTTQPILPNDISSSAEALDTILTITEISSNEIDQLTAMAIAENIFGTLDNLLDGRNDMSFQQMESQVGGTTASEGLQMTVERVGSLFRTTLNTSGNESIQLTLMGSNVLLDIQVPTEEELLNTETFNFPSFSNTSDSNTFNGTIPMIEIPTAEILNQIRNEGRRIAIVNGVIRNSHLPTDPGTRIESPVLVSQISRERVNLSNETVSILFNIETDEDQPRFNLRCAFFDFSHNSSQFSEEGVQQIGSNKSFVQCTSSHLTSFAVLVDATGGSAQSEALSIVSYVGCGISIACLTITIIVLIVLHKKVFNKVPDFIHLNLSIALLVGLIIFVSGIETAAEYRASCLMVSILLHYFFTAAFSWMLCEGVMLFIWLNYIWYNGIFKTRKFFMLLGWGLPLPIITISSAVSHEQYGTDDWCWISEEKGAIWAFIAPMLVIILINTLCLILSLYRIFSSASNPINATKTSSYNVTKKLVKATLVLLPLLGLTWVFGLLAVNEDTIVFAWIFTILNSLQGVLIMLFYVIRNQKFLKFVKKQDAFQSYAAMLQSKLGTLSTSVNKTGKNNNILTTLSSTDRITSDDNVVANNHVTVQIQQLPEISEEKIDISLSSTDRITSDDNVVTNNHVTVQIQQLPEISEEKIDISNGKSSDEFSSMAEDVISNGCLNPLDIMNNELKHDTEAQSNEHKVHSFKQEESSL